MGTQWGGGMVCGTIHAALQMCSVLFSPYKTSKNCDTVTFFPTNVPFPQGKLVDFLKQAAVDIITILTDPPSTTTPSLQAGDPVRNALLTLATQLKRIDTIPEPSTIDAQTPRVQPPAVHIPLQNDTQIPRVNTPAPSPAPTLHSPSIPVSVLQLPSAKLKMHGFKTGSLTNILCAPSSVRH